jgi:mannose-6-phosphate isomerase-like protein (cupin superfamily)
VYPHMWDMVASAYAQAQQGEEDICLVHESFAQVPNDTIDYAIAERLAAHEGAVVPLPACGWSDIGNWQSMYNAMPHDAAGNAIMGAPVAHDCKNSLIRSDGRPVIALGLENTAVIIDRDAVLVAPMNKLDALRQAVELLPKIAPPTPKDLINYRQWGHYFALLETPNYCAKVLYVAPHKNLSLQHHNYREEFWTVVEGEGFALVGDTTHALKVGSSVHIAAGTVHRLMNPYDKTLVVIEVQLGNCISEFDIVRYNEDLPPVIT